MLNKRLILLSSSAILMTIYIVLYNDIFLLGSFILFIAERLVLHYELKIRGFKYE